MDYSGSFAAFIRHVTLARDFPMHKHPRANREAGE
jgi:hypothetical protein